MSHRVRFATAHAARCAMILLAVAGGRAEAADSPPASTALRAVDLARGIVAPGDEKLDARLRALVAPGSSLTPRLPRLAPLPLPAVRGSKVHVFVQLASTSSRDLALLAKAGLRADRVSPEHGLVRGWLRAKDLRRLARLETVRSVAPVRPGHLRAGSVTSEGDAAARAPQARATGFDGTGIKVGVISDGIDHIAQSVASGNLPAGTGVPTGQGCAAGRGDEATAMLEIVHDLAPGATLLFSEGFSDKMAFVDSVTCLRTAGAQVIVDDVGFFDEPFFQDGMVAQAVRTAVQAGVSYHSAAGNEARTHYGATFQATTDPVSGATYHNFAAANAPDTFDRIDVQPGAILECVLQWNDRWGASANDYDLELWDLDANPATLLEASTNVQSGSQNPFEEITPLQNRGATTAHVGVRIKRVNAADRQMNLFCPGGSNEQYITPADSIFGHPALREVVTVGAIDVHDFGLNQVEPFSSEGPVTIAFSAPDVRPKPDLSGFDGVSTSVCPSSSACFRPFFGTSAAAPHVAGVAALLLSKNSCLTPAEVQQTLKTGADDILASGFDDVAGAGRLDALNTITAPGPCDDGNPCTVDTCTPQTGCQHTAVPDGTSCSDHDRCNGTEACQGGTCVPGTPLVCDDGNPCTTDSCDPVAGCVFTYACDDLNVCTTDTCDPMAGCQHAPVSDGTPCPDGNLCNGTETCQAGACTPGAPIVCSDGGECSTSACDRTVGCMYPPIEGFSGIACLCGRGLAPESCGSTLPPRKVARHFTRACHLVARASSLKNRRRARGMVLEAVRVIGTALKETRRASKRGVMPPGCANALGGILDDTYGRTVQLANSL